MEPGALTVAEVYADAVLGLLGEDDSAEDFHQELLALVDLLAAHHELDELLSLSLLSCRQKQLLVVRVFAGRASRHLEALLWAMARHDRLNLLRAVAGCFRRLLDVREGKVAVAVATACPLDEPARAAIVAALTEALGKQVILRVEVDEDLLGGAVVRVGDRVFDASIAADLDRMRRQLVEHRKIG
jgi:F-type H+-transporting ATPase subunit delta